MAVKPAVVVSPFNVEKDFHAPDFKRAKIKTARLAYRHKVEKKEGEPPVITFTMPKMRAFAPQLPTGDRLQIARQNRRRCAEAKERRSENPPNGEKATTGSGCAGRVSGRERNRHWRGLGAYQRPYRFARGSGIMGHQMQQQERIPTCPDDSMIDFARWIVSRDDAPPASGVRFRFKTYVAALVEAWSQNYGEYYFDPRFARDLNRQAIEAETILALHDPLLIEAFCCSRFLSRPEACSLARSFGYSGHLGAWMQDHLLRQKVLILNIDPNGVPVSTSPAPMKAGGPPPKDRPCIVGEPGPEIFFNGPVTLNDAADRARIRALSPSFPRNSRHG